MKVRLPTLARAAFLPVVMGALLCSLAADLKVTDFALTNWTELYTRARLAELRHQRPTLAAAE